MGSSKAAALLPRARVVDHEGDVFPAGTILDLCFAKPESPQVSSENASPSSESLWVFDYHNDDRTRISLKQYGDTFYLATEGAGANCEVSMSDYPYWWNVHQGAYPRSFVFSNDFNLFLQAWEGAEDDTAIEVALCKSPCVESPTNPSGKAWKATSWTLKACKRFSEWKANASKDLGPHSSPSSSNIPTVSGPSSTERQPATGGPNSQSFESDPIGATPQPTPTSGGPTSQGREPTTSGTASQGQEPTTPNTTSQVGESVTSGASTSTPTPATSTTSTPEQSPQQEHGTKAGKDKHDTGNTLASGLSEENAQSNPQKGSEHDSRRPSSSSSLPLPSGSRISPPQIKRPSRRLPSQTSPWSPDLLAKFEAGKSIQLPLSDSLPPIERPPLVKPPEIMPPRESPLKVDFFSPDLLQSFEKSLSTR